MRKLFVSAAVLAVGIFASATAASAAWFHTTGYHLHPHTVVVARTHYHPHTVMVRETHYHRHAVGHWHRTVYPRVAYAAPYWTGYVAPVADAGRVPVSWAYAAATPEQCSNIHWNAADGLHAHGRCH